MTILVLSFVGVFVVILVSVSIGWSAVEARRKKKVVGMLETVAGKTPAAVTTVLRDAGGGHEDFFTRLATQLNISEKVQSHIQQAGLDWTPGKLLLATMIAAIVGALLGWRFKILLVSSVSAAVGSLVAACVPYLFVLRKRSKRLNMFEE